MKRSPAIEGSSSGIPECEEVELITLCLEDKWDRRHSRATWGKCSKTGSIQGHPQGTRTRQRDVQNHSGQAPLSMSWGSQKGLGDYLVYQCGFCQATKTAWESASK